MSKNLMSKMYSLDEMPWHKDAFVSKVKMGAQEALSVIEGVYYEKRPVTVFLNGLQQETDDFAIIRSAIPSDPKEAMLGFVKKNYNILQPVEICSEFDSNVQEPVETIGFLGTGEKLFLCWVLPGFDVNGDEVKLYGFVAVGYDGKFGATLYVVTVRVCCANTWALAVQEGENTKSEGRGRIWSGKHNSHNLARDLGIWMEHVQEKAVLKSQHVSDIFNSMAGKAIEGNKDLSSLLFKIYPDPKSLPFDFPEKLREEKQTVLDALKEKAENDRVVVEQLFGGQGIKITADAWGLFNCVTQYENHVRMTKKPANYSILFGNRANTMSKAFGVINDWVDNGGGGK